MLVQPDMMLPEPDLISTHMHVPPCHGPVCLVLQRGLFSVEAPRRRLTGPGRAPVIDNTHIHNTHITHTYPEPLLEMATGAARPAAPCMCSAHGRCKYVSVQAITVQAYHSGFHDHVLTACSVVCLVSASDSCSLSASHSSCSACVSCLAPHTSSCAWSNRC